MDGGPRERDTTGAPDCPAGTCAGAVTLQLLGGFRVICGGRHVEIPGSTRRLVAFLALARRRLEREYIAGCLWPDTPPSRAQARLRSSLWRLRNSGPVLVEACPRFVGLATSVQVDVLRVTDVSRRLIGEAEVADEDLDGSLLEADLLPEWYDEFVLAERERLRQLRLHALEALARRLSDLGLRARALEVALTAVASEPLRESAHRAVIALHLEEGNVFEALRQYALLADILQDQLGVEPSPSVRQLVLQYGITSKD